MKHTKRYYKGKQRDRSLRFGKTALIASFFLLFITSYAQNPSLKVFEEWNTVSGTQHMFQRSVTRSVPGTSNVVIAGATVNSNGDYDIFVQKISGSGVVLWSAQYNGAGNGDDFATDIRVESNGEIYVCGTYYKDASDSSNAIVIKYNASGSQRWVATHNGSGSRNDIFSSLLINGAMVVAVGTTWSTSNEYDMLTMSLDTAGAISWVMTYDNAGLNDGAVSLSMRGGNIIIAGGVENASSFYKIALWQINPATGAILATTLSSSSPWAIDVVNDVQEDANGNIYVAGSVFDVATGFDYKVFKYSAALALLWSATWDGAASLNDAVTGLAIDPFGNVIVTGFSTSASQAKNFATVKYNSAGTLKWAQTFDGGINANDSATAIVVGDTNHIYVTGYSDNGSTKDYHTIRYNSAGTKLWDIGFNSIHNAHDIATAIALDTSGNVIITGQNQINDTTRTYTTVKYIEKNAMLPQDTIAATSSSFVFTENRGQLFGTDTLPHPEIRYYTKQGQPNVCFSDTAVSYILSKLDTSSSHNDTIVRVDMKFIGGNADQRIRALNERAEYSSFFLGHIPEGRSHVLNYDNLASFNVWNNVDIIYGSNLGGLKYYFICKPAGGSGSYANIDLKYNGADSVKIDGSGQLIIYTKLGNIVQPKAAAWQLDGSGNYTSLGWQPSYNIVATNEVKFTSLGSYNSAYPLIFAIDWGYSPQQSCATGVMWSTFIGESNLISFDRFQDVKVGISGNVYACGQTSSLAFPFATGVQTSLSNMNGTDAVVVAFWPDGPPIWSTYYGGATDLAGNYAANDIAYGIEQDAQGNIYFVGGTQSPAFPLQTWAGAYNQSTFASTFGTLQDQFIVKLNSNGTTKLWGTFYGSTLDDMAKDIKISSTTGAIYVVGGADAACPMQTGPTGSYNSSTGVPTLLKFNSSGAPIWFTKIPGAGQIRGITIDPNDNIAITGYITNGLPILNPGGNATYGGGQNDAFVTKFSGSNCAMLWSTYFGGNDYDFATGITSVQPGGSGTIYYFITGSTYSPTANPIPLANPGYGEYYVNSLTGANDGFIAQFNAVGGAGSLVWSTYFGGTSDDTPEAITADSDGNIYITGLSYSSDLPMPGTNLTNVYVSTTLNWQNDAFIACFQKVFHNYLWGTFFGGSWGDIGYGLTCDGNTKLYVVGESGSMPDFPLCQGTVTANGTPYYDGSSAPGNGVKAFISELDLSQVIISDISENTNHPSAIGLSVYPNPSSDMLWVSGNLNAQSEIKIEICDLLGQIVYQETPKTCITFNRQIDTSHFAEGIYFVVVRTGDISETRKVVIKR